MADPDLGELLQSWQLHLRAERKSPKTITTYLAGVRAFLAWCAEEDREPRLERDLLKAFVADLIDDGAEATTARIRHVAVRLFSAWCFEEGEIPADQLAGLKPPKLDDKVVQPLSTEQLQALIRACTGPGLAERRDEAVVRLMAETGARAGEVAALRLADVDLAAGTVLIRGKGGKERLVPIGSKTVRALDRYLRSRRLHTLAESPRLWLGAQGRTWGYPSLHAMLSRRAAAAGIEDFWPHRLRHTAADRWLAAGGSEQGLMAVAGWARHAQLERYTKARTSARALDEARRLDLGDL